MSSLNNVLCEGRKRAVSGRGCRVDYGGRAPPGLWGAEQEAAEVPPRDGLVFPVCPFGETASGPQDRVQRGGPGGLVYLLGKQRRETGAWPFLRLSLQIPGRSGRSGPGALKPLGSYLAHPTQSPPGSRCPQERGLREGWEPGPAFARRGHGPFPDSSFLISQSNSWWGV